MTEQEKRIEEMENICYGTGHNRDIVPDIVKYIFIALDNAGYRKAEDVVSQICYNLGRYL